MINDKLILSKDLIVQFKGDRDYINAVDMFNSLIETLSDFDLMEVKDVDFSIHNMLNSGFNFSVYSNLNNEIEYDALLKFNYKDKDYFGVIIRNELEVLKKNEYSEIEVFENSIVSLESKSIKLNDDYKKYSNLDMFSSMNKKLHNITKAEIKGKWLFVRLQLNKLSDVLEDRNQYKVKLVKVFSNKYTRSELYNSNKKIGSLYFSII